MAKGKIKYDTKEKLQHSKTSLTEGVGSVRRMGGQNPASVHLQRRNRVKTNED